MTEIVTISASTAAYATEPLKASARVSGSAPAQETMHTLSMEARRADIVRQQTATNLVGPPALALFFLTAGQHNKFLQQATQRQVEDAYFGDIEEEEELKAEEEDAEDNSDEASEEEQSEVLALPAPEHFS
jgi:hypothetical protein